MWLQNPSTFSPSLYPAIGLSAVDQPRPAGLEGANNTKTAEILTRSVKGAGRSIELPVMADKSCNLPRLKAPQRS